jgi:hypothetical protein
MGTNRVHICAVRIDMVLQEKYLVFPCTSSSSATCNYSQLNLLLFFHSLIIYHVVLVINLTPDRSPPNSSSITSKFALGFSHDRGTWYLDFTRRDGLSFLDQSKLWIYSCCSANEWRERGARHRGVPSLGDVAAVGLALGLAVGARVAAAAAAAGGLVRPVPADVVAVHPDLALAHAAHAQGHRSVAGRRVEVGLMMKSSREVQQQFQLQPSVICQ